MESVQEYDVAVIGGGASGMFAAIAAAQCGKSVIILEKNRKLGQKLAITGGGRCNVTNAQLEIREFLKVYGSAADFLFSPFSQFSQIDTVVYFESRGLPLVTEANNRVFPVTQKATDVVSILERHLKELKVTIKTDCTVKEFNRNGTVIADVSTSQGIVRAKSYILATGGLSHPETGSTGDGFAWLSNLGHTVKSPTPTIVPLEVSDAWVRSLPGVVVDPVRITFYLDGKKEFSKTGRILLTHFGLSGPLILNSSGQVGDLLQAGIVTASIDAFPGLNLGEVEKNIVKLFESSKNKMLRTVMNEIMPTGTLKALAVLLPEIDFTTKVHSVTREERKRIVQTAKALPITITGLMGFGRAVVADGGVELSEVDTKTMRSKVIQNLLVTGDLLHINRPSGGFSLQICWTSGFVAGMNA